MSEDSRLLTEVVESDVDAAPSVAVSDRQPLRILAILSTLMAFASISTDLYLPALPTMSIDLKAFPGAMELSISTYLIGFSLGQLFWGPVGDRFGRKGPVALGLVLFLIGSAGCALSMTAWQIIGWRVVQASGACAGVVLGRAMVRDLYVGTRAAQMLSTLLTVMAIAPLLGPIVGGQILHFASWRAIFWALVIIGAATLVALMTLPETLPAERRNKAQLKQIVLNYLYLFSRPRLLGFALPGAFFYSGMFAYLAGTPFAYIEYHHVPETMYGWLFALGIIGIMLTNLINARLVVRYGVERMLLAGATLSAAASVLLVINATSNFGGLAGLVIPLFLYVGMAGLIVANSIAGAMNDYPGHAGAVSALVGAMQYGFGILGSALVGLLADGTPRPLGWVIAISGVCAATAAWSLHLTSRHRVSDQAISG